MGAEIQSLSRETVGPQTVGPQTVGPQWSELVARSVISSLVYLPSGGDMYLEEEGIYRNALRGGEGSWE